ncbi:MAG: hypothetical protein EOO77_39525 [Oxalobacteraceae bacterium]|nr:MAG: hypothetical protein EOO77_39525 [Oxalobacteraceae bacterium]
MEPFIPIHAESRQTSFESVKAELVRQSVDVVVNYLPVGANEASAGYARAALEAGCAFVNCTPAPVANHDEMAAAYARAELPLLGDDIKSQIGSTAVHQVLIKLIKERGLKLTKTYQLNIGGNSDFRNMRQPERGASKKITKERGLTAFTDAETVVNVGPSDYVPQLNDFKVAYLHLEGVGLLGVPFSMDMQLRVEDSPNSTGVVLNAIRSAQHARDRKIGGVVHPVCPAFFKLPPRQVKEDFAALQAFLGATDRGTADV